tara:strand:- start:428 stop:655 length:228 start_codon:yes stop_codon:yes gene_type:complete
MPGIFGKKKAKGAKNLDKAKRKLSQFKNRKTEKAYERTRNTDLQDKPRSGNTGVYSKGGMVKKSSYKEGGFIQHD